MIEPVRTRFDRSRRRRQGKRAGGHSDRRSRVRRSGGTRARFWHVAVGRYYDPTTGQFLTLDPLVDLTGEPYGYAAGDPVLNDDPTGAFSCGGHCALSGGTLIIDPLPGKLPTLITDPVMDQVPWRESFDVAEPSSGLILGPIPDAGSGLILDPIPPTAGHTLLAKNNDDNPTQPGVATLPDLTGKSPAEAEAELAKAGFTPTTETEGGYRRYDNPDGSVVWVRPDGEVIRLGPKIDPGPNEPNYHPRYGPDGLPTDSHNTGECLDL